MQRRGGRDSPGAFDFAADAEGLIKTSIRVEADERKIIERAVRAGASKPDYNDFPIGLQNHIVALGRSVPKRGLDASVGAERLVQAAVGIKTGGDEREHKIIMDNRSSGHDLAIRLKSDRS